jgi:hypothetical protein
MTAETMPRYKLTIEYDGAPFAGWQLQPDHPTVQGALEAAVKATCGEEVRVHGAGRTDAGVHALGQVAHCDIAKPFPANRLRDALNAHLRPNPVAVLSAEIVPMISRRASQRRSGITSIASPTRGRTLRLMSGGCCACRAGSTVTPCIRLHSDWLASTISLPFAIPSARPNRRRKRWISSMSSEMARR